MLETCLQQRGYQRIDDEFWITPTGVRVWVVRCSARDAAKIASKAKSKNIARCVVLVLDAETFPKNVVEPDVTVEFFAENEPCMLVDLTQNVRSKPHRIVNDCPFNKKHLPKILADDVMVRWIGATKGDVVRVGDDAWFEIV